MRNLYKIDDWNDASCRRIGEILLEAGKINLFHISMALDIQRFQKMPIGEIFIAMNIISPEDLDQALRVQEIIQKRCANA